MAWSEINAGRDPQNTKIKNRDAVTFKELFTDFIEQRKERISPHTIERYQGLFRRELSNSIANLRAKDIRKAHVIPLLQKVASKYPTQADRLQELLQAVMRFGVGTDLIEFNPLQGMPSYGHTRKGDKYLSRIEISTYLEAASNLPNIEKCYFRFLILTGMRPGELAKLRWEFRKPDRFVIPSSHQKNNRELHLPITPNFEIIVKQLWQSTCHSEYLFPSLVADAPRSSFRKNWLKIKEALVMPELTMRDIRRTTETTMKEIGLSSDTVSSLLNHNTSQLSKIYDKSQRIDEKRKAMITWESVLSIFQSENSSIVVNF